MRAHWQAAELKRLTRGELPLGAGESQRMRERVSSAWAKFRATESHGATAAD